MRHFKLLSLAAMAVLALVAFAGAGSASATVLCGTSASPCASPLPNDTTLRMDIKTSTNMLMTTSGGFVNPTFTCTSSALDLTTTSAGGAAVTNLAGDLRGMTLSGCSSANPAGCSSAWTVTGLPTAWSVMWTTGNNGTLSLATPVMTVSCVLSGIPVNCSFGNGGSVTGSVTGGTPAEVRFINQTLAITAGFGCPTAAQVNATYSVTTPSPLFLTNN